MGQFMAGAAQIEITPPLPATLGGMFLRYKTEVVRDPLFAESLALSDGQASAIMVSCDMTALTEELVARIRKAITAETGVPPEQIILSATHTHTGPFIGYFNVFKTREQLQEDYSIDDFLIEKIARSAIMAFENLAPAKMGYGSGTAERCCFNRRYIMSNGRSMMNPIGVNRPDRLMVEGPADEQVQVVWFENEAEEIMAAVVNLSSHAAMLYSQPYLSADYPGVMRKTVWGALSGNFPILFLQGACGNIDTFDFEHDEKWGLRDDGYKHIGRILGGEVIKLISLSRAGQVGSLSVLNRMIHVPYRSYDQQEVEKARLLLEQAEQSGDVRQYLFQALSNLEERARYNTLLAVDDLKRQHALHPAELSALKIGDVIFVTNPAELFVEYQLELKRTFPYEKVIMAEITNGWCSYVPTKQAIALGGYETAQRRLDAEAGQMIVDASADLIRVLTAPA